MNTATLVDRGVGAVRHRLVDYERAGSLASRARAKRWAQLLARVPDLARLRVVDLGGTVASWAAAPVRPAHVTVVNVALAGGSVPAWATLVEADACEVGPSLGRFDLAFSNSVIEHVGGFERRRQLARAVEGLAPRHWVQTPYRYFPLEPHWLFPGFQFLPLALRARVAARWTLNPWPSADVQEGIYDALCVELLSATELRYLFPRSQVLHERAAGLVKSLVAFKG